MEDKPHHQFFQNKECRYFPCHEGLAEEEFNCLFCYCPLYALGRKCGGSCTYAENGIKDCQQCTFPHWRSNYPAVLERYAEIMEVVRRSDSQPD